MRTIFRVLDEIWEEERRLREDIQSMKPHYPNIPDERFQELVELDPTYKRGSNTAGTYGKWILGLANRNNGDIDNIGHVTDILNRFEEVKKQLKNKDIMRFRSIDELEDYLNDDNNYNELSDRQRLRQTQKSVRNTDLTQDAEKVYEDSDWKVFVPKTYEASCKLGQNTNWCTATTNDDHYYKKYTKEGNLYIIISKSNSQEKYQFHFESESYMDKNDNPIDELSFLDKNSGLFNFFKSIGKLGKQQELFSLAQKINENGGIVTITSIKKLNMIKELCTSDWGETNVKLEKVIIKNIRKIDDFKLYGVNIKEVEIYPSVEYVGHSAFSDNETLQKVVFHDGSNFVKFTRNVFSGDTSLKTVVMPRHYSSVDSLFRGCTSLTQINYISGDDRIAAFTFDGCKSLNRVHIPNYVKKIETNAFGDCTNLREIYIPLNVRYIQTGAFDGCKNLTIYCEADDPKITDPYNFYIDPYYDRDDKYVGHQYHGVVAAEEDTTNHVVWGVKKNNQNNMNHQLKKKNKF